MSQSLFLTEHLINCMCRAGGRGRGGRSRGRARGRGGRSGSRGKPGSAAAEPKKPLVGHTSTQADSTPKQMSHWKKDEDFHNFSQPTSLTACGREEASSSSLVLRTEQDRAQGYNVDPSGTGCCQDASLFSQ